MFFAYEDTNGYNFDEPFFSSTEDAIKAIIESEVIDKKLNESYLDGMKRLYGCDCASQVWKIVETSEYGTSLKPYGKSLTLVIFREPGKVTLYDKTNRKIILEESF